MRLCNSPLRNFNFVRKSVITISLRVAWLSLVFQCQNGQYMCTFFIIIASTRVVFDVSAWSLSEEGNGCIDSSISSSISSRQLNHLWAANDGAVYREPISQRYNVIVQQSHHQQSANGMSPRYRRCVDAFLSSVFSAGSYLLCHSSATVLQQRDRVTCRLSSY